VAVETETTHYIHACMHAHLEVAGVLGGGAVYDTGVGGRDNVIRGVGGKEVQQQALHRLRVLLEANSVLHKCLSNV
jgi:hypothetical protein